MYKNFKISFSYWREPRCRIRLRNQFYIDYNTPDVAPIPATINSISPLDTIPISTFMTSSLYLRKNNEGIPQPIIFVPTPIETSIPAINNTS